MAESERTELVKRALAILGVPQPSTHPDWLPAWRELAQVTDGIVKEDPRFPLIMAALDRCDVAYLSNDWPAFQQAAARVRQAVTGEKVHDR